MPLPEGLPQKISIELNFINNADTAISDIRKVHRTLSESLSAAYGLLSILREAGLGEEYAAIISRVLHLISVINMLRTQIMLLYTATPGLGVALAAISMAGTIAGFAGELARGFEGSMRA